MSRKGLIILLLILLIGSAIRFYNPTFRSLWGDEAHSFYMARDFSSQTVGVLVKDSHLPAYFALLSGWIRLFGNNEYLLRLLSIFIGIVGIVVFFFFSRSIFDEKTALVSTLLLAFSPLAVMHSQEIRMYGLMLLFSTLSSHYFWKLLSAKRSFSNMAAYVIFTVLLCFMHIYAVLLVVAQFAFLLFNCWQSRDLRSFARIFLLMMAVGICIAPIYFKLLQTNLGVVLAGTSDMAFSVFPWYLKTVLVFFVLTLGETVAPWNLAVVLPVGLIFGCLFLRNFKNYADRRIVFLLTLCLVPILISAVFLKPTMPKYLILALPFYLLLVGNSLVSLRPEIVRYILIVGLALLQIYSISNYFGLREYHNSNQIEPWREVSGLIKKGWNKDDLIFTSNRLVAYRVLQYYLNVLGNAKYPLYSLQKDIYSSPVISRGSYLMFDSGREMWLGGIKNKRVWFVTHIVDERAFPASLIKEIEAGIKKNYKQVWNRSFVSYEETLVSKLPIGRHRSGSSRISVSLYERR